MHYIVDISAWKEKWSPFFNLISFSVTKPVETNMPWYPLKLVVNTSLPLWVRAEAQLPLRVHWKLHPFPPSFKGICSFLKQTYIVSSIYMGKSWAFAKSCFVLFCFILHLYIFRCNTLSWTSLSQKHCHVHKATEMYFSFCFNIQVQWMQARSLLSPPPIKISSEIFWLTPSATRKQHRGEKIFLSLKTSHQPAQSLVPALGFKTKAASIKW